MFEFDDQWSRYCRERGVAYSRYADDLYFSTDEPNILDHLLVDLRLDLRVREWPKLVINDEKTVFTSRKRRKMVTGLLITPSGHISLGRKRMRFIKGLVFRNSLGQLDHKSALKLKGLIAFANSVDSSFVDRLRAKFGADALCELRD
jgi:retron-type reverse transcriptase